MTGINIIFSTKNKENTVNILRSIQKIDFFEKKKKYSLSIIIFDKTPEQNILNEIENFDLSILIINRYTIQKLEEKYLKFLHLANCFTKVDSIQRARIQQQLYIIENLEKLKSSIIWQVDDDMLFGKSEYINNKHTVNYSINYFSEIVQFYRQNRNVDAIIAPSTYVPPIPSLLYCETQLDDYFNRKYIPQKIATSLEYHDYYNHSDSNKYYSVFLSNTEDETTIVKNILIGKPITKVSFENSLKNEPKLTKSKLLRGGNFIVFNTEIFNVPHLGFSENERTPARRSDMVHSHLLSELGFKIRDTNYFSLVHNRTFIYSSIDNCIKKYFSDIIGALLIQYLYEGKKEFENRLQFHQKHIKNILKLLYKNVNESEFQNEIKKLTQLDVQINSLDKNHFIKEFENFKKTKEQLKLELCKLAL